MVWLPQNKIPVKTNGFKTNNCQKEIICIFQCTKVIFSVVDLKRNFKMALQ